MLHNFNLCRRKSTRLTAVVGGLTMALAILFASFAKELHQVMIRWKSLSSSTKVETSFFQLWNPFRPRLWHGSRDQCAHGENFLKAASQNLFGCVVHQVSQYFKRKRQNVEILTSMGGGLGLTMFTNLLNELITYSTFSSLSSCLYS